MKPVRDLSLFILLPPCFPGSGFRIIRLFQNNVLLSFLNFSILITNISLLSMELSYFQLRLLVFLQESHPEKINNRQFIRQRSELATLAYSEAIQNGQSHPEAESVANAELYRGLHFSKYNTLFDILSEEFTDTVSEEKIAQYALELLPFCEAVFSAYPLNDGFADTPEYKKLHTVLTGKIVSYGL